MEAFKTVKERYIGHVSVLYSIIKHFLPEYFYLLNTILLIIYLLE